MCPPESVVKEHSGWKFWDAGLTPKGVEQCAKLRKELKSMGGVVPFACWQNDATASPPT